MEYLQVFCQLEPDTTYEVSVAVVSSDGSQLSIIDVTTITTTSGINRWVCARSVTFLLIDAALSGPYHPVGDLPRKDLIVGLLAAVAFLLVMFGALLASIKWRSKKWRWITFKPFNWRFLHHVPVFVRKGWRISCNWNEMLSNLKLFSVLLFNFALDRNASHGYHHRKPISTPLRLVTWVKWWTSWAKNAWKRSTVI